MFYESAGTADSLESCSSNINFFRRPSDFERELFFKYHPIQPTDKINKNVFFTSEGVQRKWLTYCAYKNDVYCSICLVFSKTPTQFATGMTDIRHLFSRVSEHEKSHVHRNSVSDR